MVAGFLLKVGYALLAIIALLMRSYQGVSMRVDNADRIPRKRGAVLAINHISYVDPVYVALATLRARRRVRFMGKAELWDSFVTRCLATVARGIPVDRKAGASSYFASVEALRSGDLVGIFPEATISQSFELKDFKSGVARMALDAEVPIVPVVVWGTQRIATKGQPKELHRKRRKVVVKVGDPISPMGTVDELLTTVKASMNELLHQVQDSYGPHPVGEYWVPARLGGSAPTLAEANMRDKQR
ncbi:1-acyl-sn-glycerol-3-phosphate acyltransferase [Hoyosella rhizosphaerae]|uniref:Acyltransferase n=1 Tax=Hoyosella rhizosphaerae TaxID=1755582 RepID=A0A916UAL8_9ACTN|nr:lysophospholipid acyltransferase family protein [Hoyosella rhizosphaerae]MBN4927399.1 1-acyl-sn-glycerol-3-phosphate acyltransferase [Hoyosella rhizosphaerae]GGC64719.1 putative acyltransferase [Hoyosella rhizosphaerae]